MEWDELLGMFSDYHREELTSNPWWLNEFNQNGGLSKQPESAYNIYTAHVNALQSLCVTADHTGANYGIVLEEDVDVNFYFQLSARQNTSMLSYLHQYPEVTNFNLSPSQGLRTRHAATRVSALQRGLCFARHEFESWGAVAIAYNLRKACSLEFMEAQNKLKTCVPSDNGL